MTRFRLIALFALLPLLALARPTRPVLADSPAQPEADRAVISAANVARLAPAAQLGLGSILAVAFSPDGQGQSHQQAAAAGAWRASRRPTPKRRPPGCPSRLLTTM